MFAHPARHHAGFSLVEVLVAIVVLSFGLLGMVGLQAFALQANREARLQSDAVGLVRELAEQMRGNKDIAIGSAGNPYLGQLASPLTHATPSYCLNATASQPCAGAVAIGAAQMTEWLARVDTLLPGARVSVCLDAKPYDAAGLPVWDCTAGGADGVVVVKLGWTRLGAGPAGEAAPGIERTSDRDSRPQLVLPVTPGSSL